MVSAMTDENPRLDRPAFESFFAAEFSSVALVAGVTAGDSSRGEDLAQEAFVRASKRWELISTYDQPGMWVRRVAINLALNRRRRRATETRTLRLVAEPEPTELESRAGDAEVWAAIEQLSSRRRAVVVLHYFEDRPVAEIAEILAISVSATTSHLHQARQALAATLNSSAAQDVS